MENPKERILLGKLREFDTAALETVYDRYSPGLYAYACRVLGDPASAEDCVSETFSRLLKALRFGQGPRDHLQAYLYRIAHNWITDLFRRGAPFEIPLEEETVSLPDTTGDQAEWNIRRRQMHAALRRLTAEQRQAIVLRYLEGWDNEEAARAMERPVGAVKALQQRGIAALRRMLVREEDVS
ncbi:MAG: sigma-70 family RNA polymerase sigma factor [Anaerolineales bacterium]|nr:sigma-70 family RNA polymerase sigma factor [Anaerolineales bacterium]